MSQDIVEALRRPWILGTVDFSTASTGVVSNYSLSNVINGNTYWQSKLANVALVRYDVRLKFVVNAQPYTQGLLLFSYLPHGGYDGTANTEKNFHVFANINRIQLEHVTIAVGSESSAEMYIKYNLAQDYAFGKEISRTNTDLASDFGNIFSSVLAPIRVGTATPADFSVTIYVSLENIVLRGSAITQSDSEMLPRYRMGPFTDYNGRHNHADYLGIGSPTKRTDDSLITDVVSRESLLTTYAWSTANVVGDSNTYTTALNAIKVNYTDDGNSIYAISPLGMMAQLFKFYRGSLIFKIRVSCTKFHSGRFAITWNPTGVAISSSSVSSTNDHALYRSILDIQEATELEMEVPWDYQRQWCDTSASRGTLSMVLVTPLRAPALVSASIDVVVTVRGSSDFEVAVPQRNTLRNYIPLATQANNDKLPRFEAQNVTSKTKLFSKSNFGYSFTHLTDLMRKYYFSDVYTTAANSVDVMYNPSQINAHYKSTTPAWVFPGNNIHDIFDIMCYAFTYNRGSIKVRVIFQPTDNTNAHAMRVHCNLTREQPTTQAWSNTAPTKISLYLSGVSDAGYFARMAGTYGSTGIGELDYGLEVQVPHDHFDLDRAANNSVTDGSALSGYYGDPINMLHVFTSTSVTGDQILFFRSVGDDFTLRQFRCFGTYMSPTY